MACHFSHVETRHVLDRDTAYPVDSFFLSNQKKPRREQRRERVKGAQRGSTDVFEHAFDLCLCMFMCHIMHSVFLVSLVTTDKPKKKIQGAICDEKMSVSI